MRINGITGPLNVWQKASGVCFLVFVLLYHTMFVPGLAADVTLLFHLLYAGTFCLVVALWFAASSINPIDNDICVDGPEVFWEETHEARETRRKTLVPGKRWCPFCLDHVHDHSKHCRVCDKCVHEFDHHCRWLNSCVGSKNYRLFFALVLSVLVQLVLQLGVGIYVFVLSFIEKNTILANYQRNYPDYTSIVGARAAIMITLVFVLPFALSIGQLLGLHIWLNFNNLTTYAWILQTRDKKRLKAVAKAEAAKREQAKQQATFAKTPISHVVAPEKKKIPVHKPAATNLEKAQQFNEETQQQQQQQQSQELEDTANQGGFLFSLPSKTATNTSLHRIDTDDSISNHNNGNTTVGEQKHREFSTSQTHAVPVTVHVPEPEENLIQPMLQSGPVPPVVTSEDVEEATVPAAEQDQQPGHIPGGVLPDTPGVQPSVTVHADFPTPLSADPLPPI